MAQNSKNQIYIHDESLSSGSFFSPAEYVASTERQTGFVPNTTVSSKQVNTALLESTFVVTGIVESLLSANPAWIRNINPSMGLTSFTTFFLDGIKAIKPSNATHADAASKVDHQFTLRLNNNLRGISFDGSANVVVPLYAASVSGTSGQILKSAGANTEPIWIDQSDIHAGYADEAAMVSHTLQITLNQSQKSFDGSDDTSLIFFAPTTIGATGQILKTTGSGAPIWADPSTITAGAVSNLMSITLNGTAKNYDGSVTKSWKFWAPTSAGTSGQLLKSNGSGAPSWVSPGSITVNASTALKTSLSGNNVNAGNSKQPVYFSNGFPYACDLSFIGVGWLQHQDNIRLNGQVAPIVGWSNGNVTSGFTTPAYTTNETKCPWDTTKDVWMQTWFETVGRICIAHCYVWLSGTYIVKDDYALRIDFKNLVNARYGQILSTDIAVLGYQATAARDNADGQTANLVTSFDGGNCYVYIGIDNDQRFQGVHVTAYLVIN